MDKNVDQGSAVEFTAAHPRLTSPPEEEEKSLYVFFCISASFSIGREIRCLQYAGFFLVEPMVSVKTSFLVKTYFLLKTWFLVKTFFLENQIFW